MDLYVGGGGHAPPEDGDGVEGDDERGSREANTDKSHEAIAGQRFLAYIIMMEIAPFVILVLSVLFDDCRCRGSEPGIETAGGRRQRRKYYKRAWLFKCRKYGLGQTSDPLPL